MFDSKLTIREINKRSCWQAIKKITIDNGANNEAIIKEYIKKYGGKVIRIKTIKYILIYFNNEK